MSWNPFNLLRKNHSIQSDNPIDLNSANTSEEKVQNQSWRTKNEDVADYLDNYITDPDPKYAVALCGEWGCGKSFFIDKWRRNIIEKSKGKYEGEDTIVLSPIYLSLFGLSSVSEIVNAINRELYPILYSNGAKVAKKILSIAGKAVLRTGLDMDNDSKEDVSLSISLDALGLLQSKDNAIKGDKFLIIDDFERCNIEIKNLLGFVNWLVEIAGCHVIIIGDFSKLNDNSKKLFDEFREKTIGRKLEVKPNIRGAIGYFLNDEIPTNEWTSSQIDLISWCVNAVDKHNLRILRQAVHDFNILLQDIDADYSGSQFMRGFLASFIISSLLYHDIDFGKIIKDYQANYYSGLAGEPVLRMQISSLQNRCEPISSDLGVNVLDRDNIAVIVDYLNGNNGIKDFIKERLRAELNGPSIFDQLARYEDLEDDRFNELCCELEYRLINNKYKLSTEIGRAVGYLTLFDSKLLLPINRDALRAAADSMIKIIDDCNSAEEVYSNYWGFKHGCYTDGVDNKTKESICNQIFDNAVAKLREAPNKMQVLLRNLNDNTVKELPNMDKQTAPDGKAAYELYPIFYDENPEAILEALRRMTNKNRRIFVFFLRNHYHLDINFLDEQKNRYKKDFPFIFALKKLVHVELQDIKPGPTHQFFEFLSNTLSDITGDHN